MVVISHGPHPMNLSDWVGELCSHGSFSKANGLRKPHDRGDFNENEWNYYTIGFERFQESFEEEIKMARKANTE